MRRVAIVQPDDRALLDGGDVLPVSRKPQHPVADVGTGVEVQVGILPDNRLFDDRGVAGALIDAKRPAAFGNNEREGGGSGDLGHSGLHLAGLVHPGHTTNMLPSLIPGNPESKKYHRTRAVIEKAVDLGYLLPNNDNCPAFAAASSPILPSTAPR